jgi:hypothetical protein
MAKNMKKIIKVQHDWAHAGAQSRLGKVAWFVGHLGKRREFQNLKNRFLNFGRP